MSKALQCDRCGAFFAPGRMAEHELFTTIHGYGRQSRANYNMNECWDRVAEDVHLCPECTKMFAEFMRNEEVDDNETDQDTDPTDDCFSNALPPSGLRHFLPKCEGGSCERVYYDTNCTNSPLEWEKCTAKDGEHRSEV